MSIKDIRDEELNESVCSVNRDGMRDPSYGIGARVSSATMIVSRCMCPRFQNMNRVSQNQICGVDDTLYN